MEVGNLMEMSQKTLLRYARDKGEDYGEKFQRFSSQIFHSFEKIARIAFRVASYEGKQLPLAIFASIIFMKNNKMLNDDFSCIEFLDKFKERSRQLATSLGKETIIDDIQHFIRGRISSSTPAYQIFTYNQTQTRLAANVHELMNLVVGEKQGKEIKKYNEEQLNKIGTFFGEKIYLINYDESKEALNNIPILSSNVYVLKAKDMYFLLFKEKEIQVIEKGLISHEELASIFNVQNKLEKPASKIMELKVSTKSIDSKEESKLNMTNTSSTSNLKKTVTDISGSRIKQSTLFPDYVSCVFCCKKVSEFSAIYWSYSYYCFECVLNPKKDISFIPSSIIQKFLKNKKIQNKEYLLICSECKSDTIIPNYRPWDKPKYYRCKACQKEICVEHEKMVNQCFCRCTKCDKRTITISSIFIKYCLSCKIRFCQTCEKHSQKECKCICQKCGSNKNADHDECIKRCHNCSAKNIALIDCACKKMLCPSCFFKSMDPNSTTCIPHQKEEGSNVEVKA